jgi:hypothetical protein
LSTKKWHNEYRFVYDLSEITLREFEPLLRRCTAVPTMFPTNRYGYSHFIIGCDRTAWHERVGEGTA